jgi:hypothetical protein
MRQMVSFLLFRHRLSPYHAVSSSGNQHFRYLLPPESAARGVGKPHRWSKSAKSITFALTLTLALTLMRILISIPGFTTSIHICSHVLNCTCLNFRAYIFDRRPATPPRHDAFGLAILLRLANSCIRTSRRLRSRLSLASRKRLHPRKPAISFGTTHDSFEIICGLSEAI